MSLEFDTTHARVKNDFIESYGEILNDEALVLKAALEGDYSSPYSFIKLPFHQDYIEQIKSLTAKYTGIDLLVVIGIGGSSLGAMAAIEAILGKQHNFLGSPKVLFLETVDSAYFDVVLGIIKEHIDKNKKILLNVISKSGTTLETLTNLKSVLDFADKNKSQLDIVAITEENSSLWNMANENSWDTLSIPVGVGGRFSVFSAVGLFPLAVLGIDIDKFVFGAQKAIDKYTLPDWQKNPAIISSGIIFYHYGKGLNIHNTFVFNINLESFGKWYSQLVGESLGKEKNINKETIFSGITPLFSIGSNDLHSTGQLYLGGPFDKFTSFIKINERENNEDISKAMSAIYKGTKVAYVKGERPFSEIILGAGEEDLGELMQFKMIEIVYLAKLMQVNAFDQPAVENYKVETKRILE